MDKRLVGQWYKEKMGETLNIFDEQPLRMKMSFTSSGHYNFVPNCVYEKDGCFCYEINDDKFRMVYHVKYENESLIGFYTQFGKDTAVEYKRISAIPEDNEYYFKPAEYIVPETDMTRIEVLRKYSAYSCDAVDRPFTVDYILNERLPYILSKYDYEKYTHGISADDDALAFSLLDFVCDHFRHDGRSGMPINRRAEDIIRYCDAHDNSINCRGLSILLASLLRMNGIRAAHVTCMPYEEPFNDCHVVVDCFLPSGKRIMLDPTYRLYLKDESGEYVSLPRLRTMLINGEPYTANEKASYNGGGFDAEYQRNYMIKNTFRFSRGTVNGDGMEENARRKIELIPLGYPTDKFDERIRKSFIRNDTEFWK